MNRFGWSILALLILGAGALALVVRIGGPRSPSPGLASDSRVLTRGPGALIVPVRGVAAASLSDDWGDPRGAGTRAHHAIDIMAPRGTPVLAAASGLVEKLFESRYGGHTLYVRSPDGGTVYYYAHLDGYSADLREGGRVAQGQPIASVGSTGDADLSAPHLHFEIKRMAPGERWWQGTEIDPYPVLAGR